MTMTTDEIKAEYESQGMEHVEIHNIRLWDDPGRWLHMFPPSLNADCKLVITYSYKGTLYHYTVPYYEYDELTAFKSASRYAERFLRTH